MKMQFPLVAALAVLLNYAPAIASSSLPIMEKPVASTSVHTFSMVSIARFLTLTPREFEALSGKKLNLLQKAQFSLMQHRLRKMVRKGYMVTLDDLRRGPGDPSLMNILGVLLGALLGPIGVIIALLLKENGRFSREAFHWSLIGLVIFVIWFIILV